MWIEHVDVLIVGAGLSGIGAGYHLQANCPGQDLRDPRGTRAIGGTWDLFRYPGIRSDSDMYTLGYSFRPWAAAKSIADGPSILDYVARRPRDHGIEQHIRFDHRVVRAEWSTADARWTVEANATDTRRDGAADLRLPVHVQRLLPLRRGLHARLRGHRALRRARSSTRSTGPRTSTTRASASS